MASAEALTSCWLVFSYLHLGVTEAHFDDVTVLVLDVHGKLLAFSWGAERSVEGDLSVEASSDFVLSSHYFFLFFLPLVTPFILPEFSMA